jgi:tetratricopeptide (TPR) repeat protein
MRTTWLVLSLSLTLGVSLATWLEPWFQTWAGNRAKSANVLSVALGDGRKLFASHFFAKADAYFHSGFYPTIFDNREAFQTPHVAADAGAASSHNQGDESGFLGKPRDWIDAFSRQFFPSTHTHLDEGGAEGRAGAPGDEAETAKVREILPWLRLAAELDPEQPQTYVVASYWLRTRLGKVDEAEEFLREGLRYNLGDPEILWELGQIYSQNRNDPEHAGNVWEWALRNWRAKESAAAEPNLLLYAQLLGNLAKLEEDRKNYSKAIDYVTQLQEVSPNKASLQEWIKELKQKKT